MISYQVPLPHNDIGNWVRAMIVSLVGAGQRRHARARRAERAHYPERRDASLEEAAMAREMYRL